MFVMYVILFLGRILSVTFVCLGFGDREQTYLGLLFLLIGYGGILNYLL